MALHLLVDEGESCRWIWLTYSKFKVARGGGRHFSRDVDPRNAIPNEDESEEESSEEESSEEEDVVEAKLAPAMATVNLKLGNTEEVGVGEEELSRAERKALKKAEASGKKKVQIKEPESSDEEEPAKPAPKPVKKAEPTRREKYVSMWPR